MNLFRVDVLIQTHPLTFFPWNWTKTIKTTKHLSFSRKKNLTRQRRKGSTCHCREKGETKFLVWKYIFNCPLPHSACPSLSLSQLQLGSAQSVCSNLFFCFMHFKSIFHGFFFVICFLILSGCFATKKLHKNIMYTCLAKSLWRVSWNWIFSF